MGEHAAPLPTGSTPTLSDQAPPPVSGASAACTRNAWGLQHPDPDSHPSIAV
jgi:hypothetical protein